MFEWVLERYLLFCRAVLGRFLCRFGELVVKEMSYRKFVEEMESCFKKNCQKLWSYFQLFLEVTEGVLDRFLEQLFAVVWSNNCS